MNSAGAGLAPKEFGRQVIAAAATRRREGHDGGVGLFKRDDIGYGLMLGRLGHHQDVGRLHGHRHVIEVIKRIVRNLAEQMRGNNIGAECSERSEERSAGNESFSTGRSGWSRYT